MQTADELRARPPQIALIGFPMLEMRPNPSTQALASIIMEEKHWEIALAAKEWAGGIRLAEKMGCDGALVRLLDREMARAARSARIPLVNVSGWLASTGVATVKCDNAAIGKLAATHLLEKNFKHLAVVVACGGALNQERCNGFLEHAAALGHRVECFRCKKNAPVEDGAEWETLAVWLRSLCKPTGLFLTDDTLAKPLLDSLRGSGISVPYDVGIVCGPLYPDRSGLCSPSLTNIDPDTAGVYRRALDRLENLMRTPGIARPKVELLAPYGLCQGESTRLSARDDPLVARAIRIIDTEELRGLNINLLCAKLGVACSTLERHFNSALGVMPHAYLTSMRIASAKKQLAASDNSIEKVAASCGFSSRKRLNLVFTAYEGISPRNWRVQCHVRPIAIGR